jgi:phage-related protein (TIGR01555 family)
MGTLSFIADGLANVLTGRGTQVDRASHNFWVHMPLTADQIEAAYRSSWLMAKIVDLVPMDMVREWREWEASSEEVKKIEEAERRLKVSDAILTGLIYGRLGGGVVILGSGTDMAAPLRNGDKLLYVKALPRQRISLGDMDWDVDSENFGEPGWFTLAGTRAQNRIHPSRVIVFKGERVPGLVGVTADDAFWGDSIIDRVNQAVKNANTATDGFATLIDEAKIDVFRFSQMADTLLQPDGDAKVQRRVELTSQGKSTHRAIFLDKEDEWETRQLTWAGMPDMIKTYLAIVAGAADIPATRLLGKSPDGQNATGESDEKNYRSGIRTRQLMQLRPALDKLDALLLPTAGVPLDLTYSFCELDAPTEKEQAEIDKLEAETVELYASSGLIPTSALAKSVQARMVESERWPELKDELAKAPEIPDVDPANEPDPSALTTPQPKGGNQPTRGQGANPANAPSPA